MGSSHLPGGDGLGEHQAGAEGSREGFQVLPCRENSLTAPELAWLVSMELGCGTAWCHSLVSFSLQSQSSPCP